jgi:CO/xanthine dehydrogenase FAD-binding subunit
MVQQTYTYIVPTTLRETLHALSESTCQALPLAGGTHLLVNLRQQGIQPERLVDLRYLEDLKQIRCEGRAVHIGALVTFAQLEHDRMIQRHLPLLAEVARTLGNPLVRAAATLGGNVAASHTLIADAVGPLIALDALLVLQNDRAGALASQRTLSVAEYVLQPPDPRELITWIKVPVPLPASFSFYAKVSNRQAGAPALASIAVNITLQDCRITAAGIVLGALTLRPLRLPRLELLLQGESVPLREAVIDRCLHTLQADLPEPLADIRASAAYRAALGSALVKRALNQLNQTKKETRKHA